MDNITSRHPLDGFFTAGLYKNTHQHQPKFTIRSMRDLSIVELILFDDNHHEFTHRLRSILGLIRPDINRAYVAGTRIILRPQDKHHIITTEGEARGVLAGRLDYGLRAFAGVFEKSATFAVLRIDGYDFYEHLEILTANPHILLTENDYCTILNIDDTEVILHRRSEDVHFMYLPRSSAPECYRRLARSCLEYGVKLI